MKRILFTIALATFSWCTFATTHAIPAVLQTATVYQTGAELTHTAILDLQSGENVVRIEGLSPRLVPNSVQVMLSNGVVISSFECSIDYLSSGKYNKEAQALRDSLTQSKEQLVAAQSQVETTKTMLSLLQKGIEGNFAATKQAPTTENIDKNLTFYQSQSQTLYTQLANQNKRVETIQKRIQAIEKQLNEDKNLQEKQSAVLTLNLNAPNAVQQAHVRIQYFTRAASWTPQYDINVTDITTPLSLISKASVQQRTGLDWEKVKLTLSTYEPSTNNIAPEFDTWFLHQPTPRPRSYTQKAMSYNMVVTADVEGPVEMEETNTMEDYITQSEQALSISYVIDIPYTILGNGKAQIIPLNEKQITSVKYEYFLAPTLSSTAYLLAKITDWEKLNLLNGMAGITYSGTYYGHSYLNTANTDKALQLTLGVDSQIAVQRDKVSEYSSERILGGTKTTTQTFKTTIRNNKNRPVTIRLQEQYPVSTSKDITVELTDQTTRWEENDSEKGLLTYSLTLQPGESKDIIIGYTVKAPKDWYIGL